MLYACYSGDADKANAVLDPILNFGTPIQTSIEATDYVSEQKTWDDTDPRANGSYLKSGFISELQDGLIDAIVDGFEAVPDRTSQVFFQCSGGAISRVKSNATAFVHRFAIASVFTTSSWPAGADRTPHVDYVRKHWAAMEPYTRGWYVNEIANESQEGDQCKLRGQLRTPGEDQACLRSDQSFPPQRKHKALGLRSPATKRVSDEIKLSDTR